MEEMMPDAVEGLAKYRPWVIGTGMLPSLSRTSGLTDSSDILRKIDGLVRDQPDLRRTSIEVEASRAERQLLREMYETSTPEITQEQEVACFAAAIANARNDIAVLQRRANAWAEGQLAELIGLQTSREQQDYCTFRIVGSVEREVATRLSGELWERWHAAVDAALSGNESTVALLPVNALIDERETGILQQLQRRGYTVERAP
jgi:hypothetical protein